MSFVSKCGNSKLVHNDLEIHCAQTTFIQF